VLGVHLVGDVISRARGEPLYQGFSKRRSRRHVLLHSCDREERADTLHKFWDDLITGSEGFQTVKNKAIELLFRKEHARTS